MTQMIHGFYPGWQASYKWDQATHQVFSAEEFENDEFLMDDDEYNKPDEPIAEKTQCRIIQDESHIKVQVPVVIDLEDFSKVYKEDDSVSTLQQAVDSVKSPLTPSTKLTPSLFPTPLAYMSR
jgi:hypothetical protein